MKRAALYARVSTRRQEHEGTIESQIASLKDYATQHGYEIMPDYQFLDQGISGAVLVRPGLERLRDAAYRHRFSYLLVLDADRLARSLVLQLLLLDELRQAGVEVIFLNSPQVGETAQESLLFNIAGIFAEYERSKITERMRRGWLHKVKTGERVPQPAPYGYRYIPVQEGAPNRWEINTKEAEIVKTIFRWYTEDGFTMHQIVQKLNSAHHLAPKGGQWGHSSVRRVLCNQSYTGQGYYNRHRKDHSAEGSLKLTGHGRVTHPRLQPRNKEEWIAFTVPAIISQEQWDLAQKAMEQNQKLARRNGKRTYLLRSLMFCGVCQRPMQGVTYGKHSYYRCPHGGKNRPEGTPQHTMIIPRQEAEQAVWAALQQLLQQPERIAEAWRQAKTSEPAAEPVRWQQRIRQLQAQRERLVDAYQEGYLSRDDLAKRQTAIMTELESLQNKLQTFQDWEDVELSLEEFTAQIKLALNSTDVNLQRQIIRLLIERIVVHEETMVIEHLVPTNEPISKLRPQRQGTKPLSCKG